MTYKIYNSPIGEITLVEEEGCIVEVAFGNKEITEAALEENSILEEAGKQLEEYFTGKRKEFDLPLKTNGTEFRQKVWKALCTIPYGETRTYKEIAIQVGNPKASRAVGMANHNNPIGIVIPCHRVIGTNGKLVGYAGGMDKKTYLLELEKEHLLCKKN